MQKRALGKGLDAIFSAIEVDNESSMRELKISEIEPNKNQPRKTFDEDGLEALARSIKDHGVIQPIIVTKLPTGFYQIIAGERRWRAARKANQKTIPAIVRDLDNMQIMEIALIENLQREDLNAIEESEGYKRLMDDFDLTQEEISQKVGRSRPAVANALRLLSLPDEIKLLIMEDKISGGHAKAILSIPDRKAQVELANKIWEEGISVREAERLAKQSKPSIKTQPKKQMVSPQITMLEDNLSSQFGTKVRIIPKKDRGKIELEYYDIDDLNRLISLLNVK